MGIAEIVAPLAGYGAALIGGLVVLGGSVWLIRRGASSETRAEISDAKNKANEERQAKRKKPRETRRARRARLAARRELRESDNNL